MKEEDFNKLIEKDNQELSHLILERIKSDYGSLENYNQEMDRIRVENLKKEILDWTQLPQYCFDHLKGFENFYKQRIENGLEDEPWGEYSFLTNFYRVFIESKDFNSEKEIIQFAFDLLLDIFHRSDESVRNEILVVTTEDFDLKYGNYIRPFEKLRNANNG